MAGGTYTSQNKKQPGVYINVKSDKSVRSGIGSRGIVTICEPLSWGPEKQVTEIRYGDNYEPYIGYGEMAEEARFLREVFKGSDHTSGPVKVLLYRPEGTGAAKAEVVIGKLKVTARYNGIRGNDITIVSVEDPDMEGAFKIQTILDGTVKNEQLVKTIEELQQNDWVAFSGSGELQASAGSKMAGGSNGTLNILAFSDYLSMIEAYDFNILIYDGSDQTVKEAIAGFVDRMRNSLGKKCQAVMSSCEANSEGVISVKNGVVLSDGSILTPERATWWVGGAQAGVSYHESLVYAQYPGAKTAEPRLSSSQIDEALVSGHIVFMEEFGAVKVVSDINTLVSLTPDKGSDFQLNQVIRILDTAASDIYEQFSKNYIGKVQNDENGRDLLKCWIVGYLRQMQANGGIQNFDVEDVMVSAGENINAVVIDVAIQPVAAVEKIYITVRLTEE